MSLQQEKTTEYLKTSDICLATTISLWYPLDSIERTGESKVVFLFKRDEQLDELVQAYWRKELKVEPQSYFSALKFLKNRIHEREAYK